MAAAARLEPSAPEGTANRDFRLCATLSEDMVFRGWTTVEGR